MSEPAADEELFRSPRRLFEDAPKAKWRRQVELAAILFAPPEPEPGRDDETLDLLADRVAERIADRLGPRL
jgi:hypothetical protein